LAALAGAVSAASTGAVAAGVVDGIPVFDKADNPSLIVGSYRAPGSAAGGSGPKYPVKQTDSRSSRGRAQPHEFLILSIVDKAACPEYHACRKIPVGFGN